MALFCKFVDQGSNLCGNRGFPSHTKNTDRASSGNNSPCRGSELGFRPREVSGEALDEVWVSEKWVWVVVLLGEVLASEERA